MRCRDDSGEDHSLVQPDLFLDCSGFAWHCGVSVMEAYIRQSCVFQSECRTGSAALDEVEEERAVESCLSIHAGCRLSCRAAMDGGAAGIFSTLWNIITRGDIRDPKAFINNPMPYLGYALQLPDIELDEAVEVASGKSGRSGIDRPDEPIDISRADSNEDHAQEVSEDIKIQISQIQVDDHPIEMNGEGPKILIYHSHSRESYKQNPKDPYKEAFAEPFVPMI